MNKNTLKQAGIVTLMLTALLFVISWGGNAYADTNTNTETDNAIVEAGLRDTIQARGSATYLIILKEQADLSAAYEIEDWEERGWYVYNTLREVANNSQAELLTMLRSSADVTHYQPYFIVNAIHVTSGVAALDAVAAHPGVDRVEAERIVAIPEPEITNGVLAPEWGVEIIRATEVWDNLNVFGAGVVLATIDTGVQYDHPALEDKYRGTATGSHDFNFFDPAGICAGTVCDNNGHGTHVTGTMVGDDGGANQIGVAPQAQWIAAKGCESNSCSDASLLASAEWMLAPCAFGDVPGSPSCDPNMRPHVVNNSWGGPGGDDWYQPSVDAWRAAGMIPIFSAGNSGPGSGTIGSPSDYCNAMSIGGTNSSDGMYNDSSRGPGAFPDCTDKPDVSAPGQGVRSSVPTNSYATFNGTSMASPHVSGCVALMMSVAPMLDYDQVYDILTTTAEDLGAPGFNYDYGHGRIDCYEAVLAAQVLAGPTGTLDGQVTADGSGDPLAGALIEATLNITTTRTAVTDAAGEYIMTFVPEGTYDVTASLFGYLPQTFTGVEVISGTVTTQDFALELAPSHTVSGVVTDGTTGWPLYASIEIEGADIPPVWTDPADGSYSILLPEGITYTFTVQAWVGGYEVYSRDVGSLTGDVTEDFGLQADLASCSAPGYSLDYLYYENFVADNGGYTIEGPGPAPWQWGTPVSWPGTCVDGSTCWGTNLNGNYNSNTDQSILSPVIDLTAVSPGTPLTVRWHQAWHIESATWDKGYAEVSIDGGPWQIMWEHLGSTVQIDWTEFSYDISAAASSDVQFRFRLESDDIINFNGYYIDAIGIASGDDCTPASGGLVVGNVYDDNTMAPLVGSLIMGDSGQATTALAIPADPNVDDAFYTIFAPAGSNVLTATIGGGYGPDVAMLTVNDGETVPQDFWLPAGWLSFDPLALDVEVEFGSMATYPLTLTNSGGISADFMLSTDIEEQFEGIFPPAGWTVIDNGGDCVWQRNDDWPRDNLAGGDGFSAAADSDRCGPGTTMDTELRTPAFDLIGATSASLDFVASYNHLGTSSFRVDVSPDGGDTWDNLLLWTASVDPQGPGQAVNLDLAPYVGLSDVVVRFHYIATSWHWWAQVDQVQVVSDGSWLDLDPDSGTVAASDQVIIDAIFDATDVPEPGQYTTAIYVDHDTPYAVAPVDVIMNVIPSPDMGLLQGTVNSQGYCDSDPFPAAGANVLIESATNTWNRTADENGYYSLFVNAGQSPLTVTVSAPAHEVGMEADVTITAQMTTTVDFDLRWLVPCISTSHDTISMTVESGESETMAFTIFNDGGGDADFEFSEQVGGYSPMTTAIGEEWEVMAPLPAGRVFNAVVADQNGYVYVIGGTSDAAGNTATNTNYRYDTSSNTWSTMAPMPASLMSLNGVEVNNKIYIPGDSGTATTYVYDIAADSWSSIPANGGYTARSQYQIVAIGTDVYVLGGIVAAASASTTQVWVLDTISETWSAGVPMQNTRTSFAAAAINGEIYVAGGVAFPGFAPDMTTEKFDGTTWSYVAGLPSGGGAYTRWSYNAAAHGADGLWLAAGRRDAGWNVLNHAGYYNPDTDTWTASPDVPTLSQGRVYMEGAVAIDGYFYVIGGRDGGGTIIYSINERLFVGASVSTSVPWLSYDPETGEVPADDEFEVEITFTAFPTMPLGVHTATLSLLTNDPVNGRIDVPLTMLVTGDPTYVPVLSPDTDAAAGDPGTTVTYDLTLTNLGNSPDTISLSLSGNVWDADLSFDSAGLLPGESMDIAVEVTIPADALAGEMDMVTVTAVSDNDPTATSTAELTTSAHTVHGMDMVAHDTALSGAPGAVVHYNLTLTNTGNISDTYLFAASGHTWNADHPGSVSLDVGESADVTVSVTIPESASHGNSDTVVVTVTSDGDSDVSMAVNLTTTAVEDAWLQVAHLAPFAMDPGTAVTVTVNGDAVLTDFAYGDSTDGYLPLPEGTYDIAIWPAGSSSPAISATVQLEGATYYSAVAIGDGVNQSLSLLLLEDDNTAPAAGNFKIRLGHLAPFAAGGATADIRLADGTPVLEGVDFGDVSGYLELPAGTYDLIITAPGGSPTLINPEPVTFVDGDIITAFATGDGNNQALGVFAWPPNAEGFFLPLGDIVTTLYLPIIIRN